jgi:anti-sigma-K factor RskA
VRELLGPYVLGALNSDEEKSVEQHLAGCATCREEEHGLRETHEHLAGTSVAASSAPSDLKARLLAGLPPRDGSEAASGGAARGASRFVSWRGWVATAAAAVLLLIALASVAYSAGFFDRTTATATLAPTELAPRAGGELKVRNSSPNAEASLEVWGLPQTKPEEYYELWFGKEGGRVSAGTFTVDEEGRCTLSTSVPPLTENYQRVGITLERFPEEPRMSSAEVVLRGNLQES